MNIQAENEPAHKFKWVNSLCLLAFLLALVLTSQASAQEMLQNRSFEDPYQTTDGNHLLTSIPNWTLVSLGLPVPNAYNIVLPAPYFWDNPRTPPPGGGRQYFDVTNTDGTLKQSFSVSGSGIMTISGCFALRDIQQNLTGMIVRLRDEATGAIVASSSVSFVAAEPIGTWKCASATMIQVGAGTYSYEAVIPNYANFDLASAAFDPPLQLSKSVVALTDPVNGASNPKMIPGGVAQYTIAFSNPASYTVTSNSMVIVDQTPANLALVVADIAGTGSGPANFAAGGSGLSYVFAGLASGTDNIDFSNDGGSSWSYVPVADANGADANVSAVRIRPSGSMAPGSSGSLKLNYRIK